MGILNLNSVERIFASAVFLTTLTSPVFAAEDALPWSFVNGSAEG